jgi:hypothetical protein
MQLLHIFRENKSYKPFSTRERVMLHSQKIKPNSPNLSQGAADSPPAPKPNNYG